MVLDLQPAGMMRLATRTIAKQLRADVDQLGHLKTLLEATA